MQYNNIENFFLIIEKIAITTEKIYNCLFSINSNCDHSFHNINFEVTEIQFLAKEIGIEMSIRMSSLKSKYRNNKEKLQHDMNEFIYSAKIIQYLMKSNSLDLCHINHIKSKLVNLF